MLNFSGQTKKRVVNLGNRGRPINQTGSKSFLEQSKIQRLQREEQRQREKSGLVLQSHIRRYIDLTNSGEELKLEWISTSGKWHSEQEWAKWLLQFEFLCKWTLTRQPVPELELQLKLVNSSLHEHTFSLTPRQFNSLINSLSVLIEKVDRRKDLANDQKVEITEECIIIIHYLLEQYGTFESSKVPNLISYLSKFIITNQVSKLVKRDVIDMVFKINTHDSPENFLVFLSIPNLFVDSNYGILHLNIIRNTLSSPEVNLDNLGRSALVNLLVNYLTIHGKEEPFVDEDYYFVGSVLDVITFSIQKVDDEYEDEEDYNPKEKAGVGVLPVSSTVIDTIQMLYTSEFTKQAISHFTSKSSDDRLSKAALQIFSTLIFFYPPSKSKLCMLITITPNSYKWFYSKLVSHPIFAAIVKAATEENHDYLKKENLDEVYKFIPDKASIEFFWKAIYTFEELYSYWLIVSNDLESFQDDKLSLEEVSNFLIFLRALCLTLIFFSGISKNYFHQFDKLKSISISLLNQLYMKNLRLRFLPDDFWKPKELTFNIDGLLQIVAEEEEKRISEMDIDEEPNYEEYDSIFNSMNSSNIRRSKVFVASSSDTLAKSEVLKKLPFFIAFKDRVKVFQSLIELDKQRHMNVNPFSFVTSKLQADIRREHLLEDAFNSFHNSGSNFKQSLQVSFFNEYGQEAGIDGGGITKEFLTSVVTEGFNPSNDLHLFKETLSDNQIYPNDDIYKSIHIGKDLEIQQERLLYLKFLGNVVGKCFYENVLIDVSFAPFFLNKWCNDNMKNSINDLNYLDNELFLGLMKLLKMPESELNELDLNFTINEKVDGKNYLFDLLPPNGENIKLSSSNKLSYIHQISNFKLNQSLHIQTKYFLEGLYEIISSTWLSMFDSFELQMLISGGESDVNIADWKENVEYGGYFDDDITIKYFWEVIAEMSAEERFKLIKFVTSVSRAPLLGFGSLSPRFGIRNSGRDIARLPTASTCVNLLKLPDYQDKELIRSKLLYAIYTEARFDLS
ncbi:ubiquitin-protein ligase [Scheffersomyces xylosifermentans]|uniref:ubiquitin-protein ligase n=1 Tax=Scheffersomyces xylosifermentans TaxID=1304137 RepID=UPI00315D851C